MSLVSRGTEKPDFGSMVRLAGVTVDDLSRLRHLHAQAIRSLAGSALTDEEVLTIVRHIQDPDYGLAYLQHGQLGAWLDSELVGTVSWCRSNDDPTVARITSVYVSPLFAQCGIGERLLLTAEGEALKSGCQAFSVRTPLNAQGFFAAMGYTTTSHGTRTISSDSKATFNVAFMRKSIAAPETVEPPQDASILA